MASQRSLENDEFKMLNYQPSSYIENLEEEERKNQLKRSPRIEIQDQREYRASSLPRINEKRLSEFNQETNNLSNKHGYKKDMKSKGIASTVTGVSRTSSILDKI